MFILNSVAPNYNNTIIRWITVMDTGVLQVVSKHAVDDRYLLLQFPNLIILWEP